MAQSKKTTKQEEQQSADTFENTKLETPPVNAEDQQNQATIENTAPSETAETSEAQNAKANPTEETNMAEEQLTENKTLGYKSVASWAAELRLASWQLAALCKTAGWEDDKKVTENELKEALQAVSARRLG